MRRILLTAAAGAMIGLSAYPASANDIYVGNCQDGELSRTTHEDAVTGKTTIVVCKPPRTTGP